jgi:hypothetical protein
MGDLAQQRISCPMAPGIIHPLEVVQVDEQQRTGARRLLRPDERFLEPVEHGLMIGQASNDIGDGHLHQRPVKEVSLDEEQLLVLR